MTQDPKYPYKFQVSNNEDVTVTIAAIGAMPCNTAADFDGAPLSTVSDNPDMYQFKVTGSSGAIHHFDCTYNFPGANSATNFYTVRVEGSFGGNFQAPKVFAGNDPWTWSPLVFTI
jgi:hypothetical protein